MKTSSTFQANYCDISANYCDISSYAVFRRLPVMPFSAILPAGIPTPFLRKKCSVLLPSYESLSYQVHRKYSQVPAVCRKTGRIRVRHGLLPPGAFLHTFSHKCESSYPEAETPGGTPIRDSPPAFPLPLLQVRKSRPFFCIPLLFRFPESF